MAPTSNCVLSESVEEVRVRAELGPRSGAVCDAGEPWAWVEKAEDVDEKESDGVRAWVARKEARWSSSGERGPDADGKLCCGEGRRDERRGACVGQHLAADSANSRAEPYLALEPERADERHRHEPVEWR